VAFVFIGISALFGVYFFDPTAPRFWSEFAVWVALGLSAGLVATSWSSLLLAVPAGIAVYQHVALEARSFPR
jgi:hypothetical protein